MYYIGICDDDPLELSRLKSYLLELKDENMPVDVKVFDNGYNLVNAHKYKNFHLIFLDLLMDPISGLKTAELIRQIDPLVNIIFVTVTNEYAVDGYKVNALRYLLKPVDKNELLKTVKPILVDSKKFNNKIFTFSNTDGAHRVKLSEILYFESSLKKINLVTKNETFNFYGKISEIESELQDEFSIRVHKSFIVNLRYVTQVNATSLTLDDNTEIPVSKYRYKEIMEKFMELVSQN